MRFLRLLCSLAVWLPAALLVGGDSSQPGPAETRPTQDLHERVLPLLQTHCLDCHSGAEPDAGVTLERAREPLDFLKDQAVWRKVVQKLQTDEMPPPDVSELDDSEREFLIAWVTATLEDIDCGLANNPGRVTLRRLNAVEYRNTIRDLLLVEYEPAEHFPADDVGYGFDNIGDVLTLPPLLMEKYLLAAEEISRRAIVAPPPGKQHELLVSGRDLRHGRSGGASGASLILASNGDAVLDEQIPWAGTFQLTITASGDQVGEAACQMDLLVDDRLIRTIAVRNSPASPAEFSVPLELEAGKRSISLRFTNDYYEAAQGDRPASDRNLHLHALHLIGVQPSTERVDLSRVPASHRAIFAEQILSEQAAAVQPQTAAQRLKVTRAILSRLASRAFRRPVSPEDLQSLTELALSVQAEGESLEASIQVALQAILISPKFLFRVEPPVAGVAADQVRDADDFELATRLSYFLWSTMPDDVLLKLAQEKQLRQPQVLRSQIGRMIADPKADALVENFAAQWLTLRRLDGLKPDPTLFPQWNADIQSLAKRETLTFFAAIMRDDLSILSLLDADFTYLNQELAEYYGLPNVRGEEFRKVSLAGTPRVGLLTHASILAVASNPTRTSPVKRGKWILDNLLANPPPPAPPGVPELKEKGELIGTLRERMEQHRVNAACAGCHKLMDPIGFALESFDAVGRFREFDEGQPIDDSGTLPDGAVVNGAAGLREALLERNRDQFVRCVVEKMLTYALGRGLEYYDRCAVDQIIDELEKQDLKFSILVEQIVLSVPFQKMGQRE